MLSVEEIKSFIDADRRSDKKKQARVGQRYYNADHDIKNYRIFFFDAEGNLKEDEMKSNIKIAHAFFPEIVDQQVQYMLSGEDGFIRSDDPKLQKYLDIYFNENEKFLAELEETLTGCIIKGFDFMYAYKNKDGLTAFQNADSLGVVEVDADDTEDGKPYIIYWYVKHTGVENKPVIKIQVWDEAQTHFYCQDGITGKIEKDPKAKINPRPHILYQEEYGVIPFFRLDNCRNQFSGLKPIKALIDDYDLMSCGLSNNIQDANEVLYVVKGFEGDDLDELHLNTKTKKMVGVGEQGGVDIMTIDIPYEARKIKLDLDEKNIFRFGFAVNTEAMKDSSATVSVAIKTAYALLDLKANKLETQVKSFLRQGPLDMVLKEINEEHETDYRQSDVYFKFEREIITNAQENAQIELTEAQKRQTEINTILNIAAHIDNETMMQLICEQLDIDYEDIKDKLPDPAAADPYDPQTVLDTLKAGTGGGVVE